MKLEYRAGYKYQLAKTVSIQTPILGLRIDDEFFTLEEDGMLTIRAGYAWDGASGPTFDTMDSMGPSLVHDVFCQAQRAGQLDYTRWHNRVDAFFKRMCKDCGMWGLRASIWHQAVTFANAGDPVQGVSNPVQEAPWPRYQLVNGVLRFVSEEA
jgi:hypothetical protein